MDLVFSFDSEDFLTPEAADAEKWWAELLTARGVTGSFQLVAELVRSLQRRGRGDVIEAFARHEIGYHSNLHSVPPSIPERIEGLAFGEGIDAVLRTEADGLALLVETFGRVPVTYCSPGDSWTPATLVAMAMSGVKGFCNTRIGEGNAPYWYCGALVFNYDLCLDHFFERDDDAFLRAFDAMAESIQQAGGGHIVVYTHPTRLVTSAYWDRIFYQAKAVPLVERCPAPLRPHAEVAAIQARCTRLLDRLLARRDLTPTTYSALYAKHAVNRMDLAAIMDRAGLAPGEEGRLVEVRPGGTSYLSADDLAAFVYRWPLYREGFTGERILEHAQQLAWTSAPARRACIS
jgi:hypothetical protein